MSIWNVIDSSGVIINRLQYDDDYIPSNPHHVYTNHTLVKSMGHENIGYIYLNGKIIEPPRPDNHLPMPMISPTPEQTDIAALKTDIQTLTASLTQVITALNALTKQKDVTPQE